MAKRAGYDLKTLKLPRLAGKPLRVFAQLMESGLTRPLLLFKLLRDAGIVKLRRAPVDAPPTVQPETRSDTPWADEAAGVGRQASGEALGAIAEHAPASPGSPSPAQWERGGAQRRGEGFHFATIQDYAEAYRNGRADPEQVARRVVESIAQSDAASPPLRAFIASRAEDIMAQARASAERLRQGQPLSLLDGVPVAVKDELDQQGYGTSVGTCFLGHEPAREDATAVARLRAAGAVLIGKTNMHEIGIGVTGLNVHHGIPRNPYDQGRYTGGSSSGSATAVAAGLCPVALGADGGGSVRIPAGLCGVVGLKPTFGRVSEQGAAPLTWTMAHVGPIGASAADVELAYRLIAGPDVRDANTRGQPPLSLARPEPGDLRGLRAGIYRPWFDHAQPAVVSTCYALLERLEQAGLEVREVEIPELDAARVAHALTILSEMASNMEPHYARHRADFGLDTRINLALGRTFTAADYLQGQRVRTRMSAHLDRALREVDLIITPTTAIVAPPIPPDVLPDGESDLSTATEIMRYVILANLTGHPAISFPAGYDGHGLPVGMHAMARRWDEDALLRLAHAAEPLVERRRPQVHFDLLGD